MGLVSIAVSEGIAWVEINNPPVNATSTQLRHELLLAVNEVQGCRRAVLSCAGRSFIAGGDMSEFDQPPQEPHLPDVVDAIEQSDTPFLALLHGNVLGGGLEIAMACAWRIAAPGTRFGLPEVNVGLIPGAGGSQRVPRLLGWELAADMACSGKLLSTDTMLEHGGIDLIADDLMQAAKDFDAPRPTPVSQRDTPLLDADWLTEKRATLIGRSRGQQSPLLNLDALSWAITPFAEGQKKERALHLELRQSNESKALRHVFFAERAVTRPTALRDITAATLNNIVVIGGGLMGSGIAVACLLKGMNVALCERDAAGVERARETLTRLLDGARQRGKISQTRFDQLLADCTIAEGYSAAANADLVIEAVFEELSVKRNVMAELDQIAAPHTLLATNTSYLNPEEIFAPVRDRSRCLGLHFFSPAHIMKLVEVVALTDGSTETLASAFAFARSLGKLPVQAGICDGFIGNRILAAYRRAAEYLLADGALPQEIDTAMRAYGLAMGPFEAQDMSGLQIAEANRRRQDTDRPAGERYVTLGDQLCEMGRFGQRAGAGWYRYEGRNPLPDPTVTALIEDYSQQQAITRRSFSATEIQTLLLAVMANEGARIVEEGIAQSDAAVDLVKVHGYGFPRWRGGPMQAAQALGNTKIQEALAALEESSPNSWRRARRFT